MEREFLSAALPPFLFLVILSYQYPDVIIDDLESVILCCRSCSRGLIPNTADASPWHLGVASFGFSCRNIQGDRSKANYAIRLHMEQGAITFFFFPIVPPCHLCLLSVA